MTYERVLVTMPPGLRDRAHAAGINVSGVAAAALLCSVQAIEKETGIAPSKATLPAVSSQGATS